MGNCEDQTFGILVEKTSGSLRLNFLVGRRVERLSLKPKCSLEFVALVEEDRGYFSAPESDASGASVWIHPSIAGGAFAEG